MKPNIAKILTKLMTFIDIICTSKDAKTDIA